VSTNISGGPKTLNLLPSWECDAACRHCLFSSSPVARGRLDLDVARLAIVDLNTLGSLESVAMSGGEVTLDRGYLFEIARLVRDESLSFSLITNGKFASSVEEAIALLAPLQRIGIDSIGVSWDNFHNEFIDVNHVRNLLKATRKLGIDTRLSVVATSNYRIGDAFKELGPLTLGIPAIEGACLPVGRAKKAVNPAEILPVPSWNIGASCAKDFEMLSVTPDGSVYPCCSVGGFTEGLKLGSLYDSSILELVQRRNLGMKWSILAGQGPAYLLKFLTPEEKQELVSAESQHDCVNCNRLFSSGLGEKAVQRATRQLYDRANKIISAVDVTH
jgi:hypothetical protein